MILVFGKTGQVAQELARISADAVFLSRAEADLSVPGQCAEAIQAYKPDAVINAAAFTNVDQAEEQEDEASIINGAAPGEMARACAKLGNPLVHLSTDYVFDGTGAEPIHNNAPPAPLNAYGRSKLAGEEAVRAAGGAHAIMRTSWVFSAHGSNFVKTMLRLAQDRTSISVVGDQIGGPTAARDIARACLSIAETLISNPDKSGFVHYAGTPDVSWADFARHIFALAGIDVSVDELTSSDYPSAAIRPQNSRLNCRTLDQFGLVRPAWKPALVDVLDELGTAKRGIR